MSVLKELCCRPENKRLIMPHNTYVLYEGICSLAVSFLLTWTNLASDPFVATFDFLMLLMVFFFLIKNRPSKIQQCHQCSDTDATFFIRFLSFSGDVFSLPCQGQKPSLCCSSMTVVLFDAGISLANSNVLGLFASTAVVGLLYPCLDSHLGEPHKFKREWASVMRCIAVFVGINHASVVSFHQRRSVLVQS